jgi:hypothetical protein
MPPQPAYHQEPHPAITEAQIEIAVMKSQMQAMTVKLDKVETTLEQVKELLTEARGGWKMMMMLGGAAATFGGLLTYFFTHSITIGPR